MSSKSITIVGAGIAGLVLARCLRRQGIHAAILDKVTAPPSYSYAITLYPKAYQPLLKVLDMDESVFRSRVAVDAAVGGAGRLWPESSDEAGKHAGAFRAHRAKLESLLREGLDVKLGYSVHEMEISSGDIKLSFENGQTIHSDFVVGADGVHSQIRRLCIPSCTPITLPYVVFNGKRQITESMFQETYAPYLKSGTILESRKGDILLQLSISDRTAERTRLSYTYSRPAGINDELYVPGRSLAGANDIPEAFYSEIRRLTVLEKPFEDTFDVSRMRSERLLHWLMRTTMANVHGLRQLARSRVVLIGDSIHAQPILGGMGANSAIMDGIELGLQIASYEFDSLAEFYNLRYEDWQLDVSSSEQALKAMHSVQFEGNFHAKQPSTL